jgi:tRNA pseudouridine38-40 synthase
LTLTYDGTAYGGWQRQENSVTVQEKVEDALTDLLGTRTKVIGSSRTDSGVHARGQVCHFHLKQSFPARGLVFGGNHRLPPDIRIFAAHGMPDRFHAQRCALGKEYSYRLVVGRVASPLDRLQAARLEFPVDLGAVRAALRILPGRHDFSAFALAGGSHSDPFRRLFAARLEEEPTGLLFRFWGDGFLRGMVRTLVGTLLEVGRGRRPPENLAELLRPGRSRDSAGPTAEANGLCLERVFYPPRWSPLGGYAALPTGEEGGLW